MSNRISARQLCAACFTGLLSLSAAAAGIDWRGALLAVPVVLLSVWAAASAARRTGGLLCASQGWWRRPLALFYILWGVFAAGTVLALCARRLAATNGRDELFWLAVLAALPVLWLAVSKAEAFARAAEIFYLVMLVVTAAVVLLGLRQAEWRYVWAPGENLWTSMFTAAGLGCMSVFAVLLWNGKGTGETGRWLGWCGGGSVVLAGLSALAVGCLSPALAQYVDRPFFLMSVGLGSTARTEALVATLWLAADVTLAGLLLHAGRGLWRDVLSLPGEKSAAAAFTLAALVLAVYEAHYWDPEGLLRVVLPAGGLLLGGVVPLLLRVLSGHGKKNIS